MMDECTCPQCTAQDSAVPKRKPPKAVVKALQVAGKATAQIRKVSHVSPARRRIPFGPGPASR